MSTSYHDRRAPDKPLFVDREVWRQDSINALIIRCTPREVVSLLIRAENNDMVVLESLCLNGIDVHDVRKVLKLQEGWSDWDQDGWEGWRQ